MELERPIGSYQMGRRGLGLLFQARRRKVMSPPSLLSSSLIGKMVFEQLWLPQESSILESSTRLNFSRSASIIASSKESAKLREM